MTDVILGHCMDTANGIHTRMLGITAYGGKHDKLR